ncbi:MAG: heme ABC exporter ATP-binding protein CcmA [Actinomycetota bacterium]
MSAIVVHGLERRFGTSRVLTGVDLHVDAGQHIAITGPNGSGKTTLLRVIAGLLRPTSGNVEILGGSTSDPAIRRRIGFVAHTPALYPRMTVMENLRFWARLYDAGDITDRGRELVRAVGLDPASKTPVGAYSQGMRQRAAVARALATDPQLVIADEPLAALDAEGAAAVGALLSRCPTVVVATHDLSSAEAASRFELRHGTLLPVGLRQPSDSPG